MADNVVLNSGSGGSTCATDDVGGIQFQRVKVAWGADGVGNDTSATTPLPVALNVGATATPANVTENTSSVALLASSAGRLGWSIYNDSDAALNINFGAAASATAFVIRLLPRGFTSHKDFMGAVYTGAINGIWDTAPGTAGHAAARVMGLAV